MSVHIVLLRGIGPGTHEKMRPGALRDKCEEAGFDNVVNYLATGNLILDSSKSAAAVKKGVTALVEGFGVKSEVFVVSRAQLKKVVEADPFPKAAKDHPQRLGVCFFHKAIDWPTALLKPEGPEKVAAVGPALVIDYGAGISTSKLNVEKLAGVRMTQRNWNTVLGVWERAKDR